MLIFFYLLHPLVYLPKLFIFSDIKILIFIEVPEFLEGVRKGRLLRPAQGGEGALQRPGTENFIFDITVKSWVRNLIDSKE